MTNFDAYKEVFTAALKRKYTDFFRRGARLRTPVDMLLSVLRGQGYLPREIIALELFAMHGLWQVKDYADICSYLELYEIHPIYAKYAQKFVRNATVLNADSIEAVKNGGLRRPKYNYIVSDNPLRSPYGKGYYEHFDFLPYISNYIDDGILHLSFCYDVGRTPHLISKEHREKRELFYGKANPSVKEAVEVYRKHLRSKEIIDYVFLPRNEYLSILALVLKRA